MEPVHEFTKVESIFVRHRNCLLLRGQFTPIFTDYYLHLMQFGHKYPPELDHCLKELLGVLTLHLVARPWKETHAWTVNLRAPRVNFFATGNSVEEAIAGRLFLDDVKEPNRDLLYTQVLEHETGKSRNSTLEVNGLQPFRWIESYYDQSEQRPCRAFDLGDENFALVTAQPDFDTEWFDSLDENRVRAISETEETKILETRKFRFHCGCSLERILPVLKGYRDHPDELFGRDPSITINCPRCNASYLLTREDFDAKFTP